MVALCPVDLLPLCLAPIITGLVTSKLATSQSSINWYLERLPRLGF